MRIFIHTPTGKKFPLEAQPSDTIHRVKGLIEEKEGICRLEQVLMCGGRELEDSKTLAKYYIQNESTLHLVGGGMLFRIKTSAANPFAILVRSQNPTIDDLKAEIEERMGIPANEQRLVFSGKVIVGEWRTIEECGIPVESTIRLIRLADADADADKVVGIAAVKANKEALLKDKGTRAQAEVGSKRAREDSSSESPPPGHSEGLLSCGAMRLQGMESFWDEEDFGLAWWRSRSLISPLVTTSFESKNPHMLIESVANECVRTLNVMAFLENQLQKYQDKLSRAKTEVRCLSVHNSCLEVSLQKERVCVKKVMQELDVERSTGTSFLQSEDGRRLIVTLERQAAKSGVEEYKKSPAFKELVMDRAVSVYEDTVRKCQSLLRESGQVSEDIIQLIGPRD